MRIRVGCCGWGYLRPSDYFGEDWSSKFKTVLQAYCSLLPSVEINSTFYRIPKITTAEKWKKEADEINKNFKFTVKASGLITHKIRFSKGSVSIFDVMKDICKRLNTSILLFQSPSSFKPTNENIERLESFFENINRENLILTWEMRGEWHKKPKLIKQICKKFDVVTCVDPFRNEPLYFGKNKIVYFRLHGFGLISMYHYNFSQNELNELKEKIKKLGKRVKDFYIMFNNSECYKNALQFLKMV